MSEQTALSPHWDSHLTLNEIRGRMRFAVLSHRVQEVSIVYGDHEAPDSPQHRCYDADVIGRDGYGLTYEASSSIGSTFLQISLERDEVEVTQSWDVALAHLTPRDAHV